jgi:hypothetical protein
MQGLVWLTREVEYKKLRIYWPCLTRVHLNPNLNRSCDVSKGDVEVMGNGELFYSFILDRIE